MTDRSVCFTVILIQQPRSQSIVLNGCQALESCDRAGENDSRGKQGTSWHCVSIEMIANFGIAHVISFTHTQNVGICGSTTSRSNI